eukprot:2014242-Pyramimonas_sp.AAC.1
MVIRRGVTAPGWPLLASAVGARERIYRMMGAAAASGALISMIPDAVMPTLCPRAAAACAAMG